MAKWDIKPDVVMGVVEQVAEQAEALDEGASEGALIGVLGGLTWGGGITACVAQATGAAIASQVARINKIKACITAGVAGAVGATQAYVDQDYAMFATTQSYTAYAARTGDFSWFAQNRPT